MATLVAIYQHPVKSLAAVAVDEARLDAFGLERDRRWMLVDTKGKFVTQRHYPQLVRVRALAAGGGLTLQIGPSAPLFIPEPSAATGLQQVRVWNDDVDALDAGDVAAQFFAELLPIAVRLVFMPDEVFRRVDPAYVPERRQVSFADGFPLLLLSRGSIADLNGRLREPVTERHFRPNLVVDGVSAFAEDGWRRIRIGEIELHCVKPCSRCVMTTVNPMTGEKRSDGEPLKTLLSYRKVPEGVMFGQNVVHQGEGLLRVGDHVEILE